MNWTTYLSWGNADDDAPLCGSNDIVEGTLAFFTNDIIRRIAIHRRLTWCAVNRGLTLALPFLLTALAGLASKPSGARQLARSVARQYPATPETIRKGIGTESQDVAAAYGWGHVAHLVGAKVFAAMSADIARFSGISEQEAKLLVGLVGWLLISQLRETQRRLNLDDESLSRLLHSNRAVNLEIPIADLGLLTRRGPLAISQFPD